MRKKLILFVLTLVMFLCFTQVTSAATEYICKYKGGGKDAEFRLRLDTDGKTYAETASITDDSMGEEVVNWNKPIGGTNFSGKDYYDKNNACPPYAYYFTGATKKLFGWSWDAAKAKFVVAPEASGGNFEASLKKFYDHTFKNLVSMAFVGQQQEEKPEELPTSCLDFSEKGNPKATLAADKHPCEQNPYFACIWVETNANPAGGYCNTDELQYVKCGDAFDVPHQVPRILSLIVDLLKTATPIILVIVSIVSLLKALASSKEDEIKKAQSGMIKKIIAAVMVFFIVSIVQFIVLKVADVSEKTGLSNCLSCMLNNDCQDSLYYKTNVGGQYFCTGLSGNEIECGENAKQK